MFNLPKGLVHGDLFRDNALFAGTVGQASSIPPRRPRTSRLRSCGCGDDWCTDAEVGSIRRTRALLEAYASIVRSHKKTLVLLMLVQACARFLVARLHSPRKSPAEMIARLGDQLERPMYLQPEGLVAED